jgi:hypothetical protein
MNPAVGTHMTVTTNRGLAEVESFDLRYATADGESRL